MPSSRSRELGREFDSSPLSPQNLAVRFLEKPNSGPTYPAGGTNPQSLFPDQLFSLRRQDPCGLVSLEADVRIVRFCIRSSQQNDFRLISEFRLRQTNQLFSDPASLIFLVHG